MKHIKTYESLESKEIIKLKKYVIWHSKVTDKYEIIQILSKSKEVDENNINRHTIYTCKTLYYYDKFTDKILPTHSNFEETFFNTGIINFVKYTTNNLKECKEMMLTLASSNKFNL